MKLTEIRSVADIQHLVLQGFTNWKHYGQVNTFHKGKLILFNYTQTAQYEAQWNLFEQISRGLILDKTTGEIVARPFDKFYNWLEGGRVSRGHIVTVMEKLDGSIGILYRDSGVYKIATRGAFESPQAQWATHFLQTYFDLTGLPEELTLLFEIIYPQNRIVLDYKGREDLVLLAARNRFTGEYLPFFPDLYNLAQQYGFSLPKVYNFNNVTEILEQTGRIDETQEGWVVEFSDGQRFKFKGDRYRELHALISGLTFKNVLKAVMHNSLYQIYEVVPDEFLGEVKQWLAEIQATVDDVTERTFNAYEAAPKESRKEFALWVQRQHPTLAPYLFAVWDRKPLKPLIYKNIGYQKAQQVDIK